jgi:ubiquinone/menaquinone biosynthesis C-methylase UbiE
VQLLRRLYAALYDVLTAPAERHLAPLRRRTAGRAHGSVLEIGAGTGANLPFYPSDARVSVVEPNPHMVARLRKKAAARGRTVEIALTPADPLPYPDGSFDAVIATLVLCSVPDQARVLSEARRVLRRGGELLFFEHVASDDPGVRRCQRRLNPIWRRLVDGCTLDRDTAAAIRAAGFSHVEIEPAALSIAPPITRRLIVGRAVA